MTRTLRMPLPGVHVEQRDPGPVRRAVRAAGDAHEAGDGLDEEVVAGQGGPAGGAEAGAEAERVLQAAADDLVVCADIDDVGQVVARGGLGGRAAGRV